MINKINLIKSITMICFVLSCENKNKLINSKDFVNKLYNEEDLKLPLVTESAIIFIKVEDEILITSVRNLIKIKNKNYKYFKNSDEFMFKAINYNFLKKNDFIKEITPIFKLEDKIIEEYYKFGLKFLIKNYCVSSNKNLNLKSIPNQNMEDTLLYIFFKNNYYIMEDDYDGVYALINRN